MSNDFSVFESFINKLRTAEKLKQRTFFMNVDEANQLCDGINKILLKLAEKTINQPAPIAKTGMDGGNWN